MSKLVGYSSGEDDPSEVKVKSKDVNYEEVGMDMSEDGESDSGSEKQGEETGLFATKEEFQAYKDQFGQKKKPESSSEYGGSSEYGPGPSGGDKSNEYGPGPSASSSEYGGGAPSEYGGFTAELPKKKKKPVETPEEDDDFNPPTREELRSKKFETKPAPDFQQRSRKSPEVFSASASEDRRDRGQQRRRSRSRSPRGHHRDRRGERRRSRSPRGHGRRNERRRSRDRRRDRSRDRGERRGHHGHHRGDRRHHRPRRSRSRSGSPNGQELRSRKLVACGLATQEEVDNDAMGRTMSDQLEKVKEVTGVEVPKYYNPSVINPLKYAEQIKKRKMLWAKPGATSGGEEAKESTSQASKPEAAAAPPSGVKQSFNKWESTNFGNSQANEKFRRLMGIKAPSVGTGSDAPKTSTEKLFSAQEMQYEKARAITHTQRGLGLGFASSGSSLVQDQSQAALSRQLEGATQKSSGPGSMINFLKK